MPTPTPDEIKKQTIADQIRKEEEEKRLAALRQTQIDDQQKKMKAELAIGKKTFEQDSEVKFAPVRAAYNKDWNTIVEAYQKRFNREPDKDGALAFNTKDEAISFFEDQAQSKLKFLATQAVNDQLIDFHLFSCGDGKLYKGTAAEIRAQLEQVIQTNPGNQDVVDGLAFFNSLLPVAPTPAVEMRSLLKDARAAENDSTKTAQVAPSPIPGSTGLKG